MKILKISLLFLFIIGCTTISRVDVLAVRPKKPSLRVERLDDHYAKISLEDLKKLNDYIIELEGYADKLEKLNSK